LTLSADGVLDVSVGITPQEWTTDDAGTMRITAATVDEISLVPQPAFTAAKITEVYASASIHHNPDEIDNNQENPLDEETPEMEKTPEVAAVEAATPTAPIWAEAPKRFTMPSAAQYMAAYASSPSEFAQINAQIKAAALNRAGDVGSATGNCDYCDGWCVDFDFDADGALSWSSITGACAPYGSISADGWHSNYGCAGSTVTELRIHHTVAAVGIMTAMELEYTSADQWTPAIFNLYALANTGPGTRQVATYTGSWAIPSTDFRLDLTRGGNPNAQIVLHRARFSGTGTNPFGSDNC